MRFVWAVLAFIIAAALIAAGVAQRTVLLGSTTHEVDVTTGESAFTVVDGSVLNAHPGAQTLVAEGEGTFFSAIARSIDVEGWLSDTAYTHITLNEESEVEAVVVQPDPLVGDESAEVEAADPASEADGAVEDAAAPVGRDPAGSDLWLEESTHDGQMTSRLQLPEDMSVLLAADGTLPAPSQISLSWPTGNSTPWAGPLIALGSLFALAGIVLYILALRHVRRSRGPRRKSLPPLPETEPIGTIESGDEKGVITAGKPRRSLTARSPLVIAPIAVIAVALTGCSPEAWPQLGGTASPTPSPTVAALESQQAPAVTANQAERIIADIAETVAEADETMDLDLAETRLSEAALAERATNYTIREAVPEHEAPPALPSSPVAVTLPQANDGWPRSVLAVVGDEADTTAPTILLLRQDDPWSGYKVVTIASLTASTELPAVAPETIGAAQVPPDSSFLLIAPEDLPTAYIDLIENGAESTYAPLFSSEDPFRTRIAEDRANRLGAFNETGAETGSLTFSSAVGEHAPFALATLESGAIVAVTLTDSDEVRATDPDAVIKLDGNEKVRALAGVDESEVGFQTVYSDQLFFYVPNQAAGGQIQLLGFASNIISAGALE